MNYHDDFEGLDEEQLAVYQWRSKPTHFRHEAFKLKIDLPQFDGELEMEDVLDWLKKEENYFEYTHTPDENKVKLVAYKFNIGTLAW